MRIKEDGKHLLQLTSAAFSWHCCKGERYLLLLSII